MSFWTDPLCNETVSLSFVVHELILPVTTTVLLTLLYLMVEFVR